MVPVCVGYLKYVRKGYIAWAGDGIEYAAEEPSPLLKHEFKVISSVKNLYPHSCLF
jgi:hypothetical protein